MLQYGTIEPRTLDLLKKLMQLNELKDFYLVGGTALSLIYGHRLSIDLDLFSAEDFQNEALLPVLEKNFSGLTYSNPNNSVGLFTFIQDIKVDFVKYCHFSLIDKPIIGNGIRLFSIRDIIAMKMAAVIPQPPAINLHSPGFNLLC